MAKFVKKANLWCVTLMIKGDKVTKQEQNWFYTQKEAEEFEKESVRKEQNGSNK